MPAEEFWISKFSMLLTTIKTHCMHSKKSNLETVRRPSARILMKTAFSRFVNTPDDPVCLDVVTPTTEAKKAMKNVSRKLDEGPSGGKKTTNEKYTQTAKGKEKKKYDGQSSRKKRDDKQQSKGKEVEEDDEAEQLEPLQLNRKRRSHKDVTIDQEGLNGQPITRGRISGKKRKDAENRKSEEIRASMLVRTRSRTSEKLKGKGKAYMNPDANIDSDFEEPRFPKVGIKIDEKDESGARKKEQKKKKEKIKRDDQKVAVEIMGLGSFIGMIVDGIPFILGYFVVNNLDTNSMQLRLNHGTIIINEETIHQILQVPIGGIGLTTIDPDSEIGCLRHQRSAKWCTTVTKMEYGSFATKDIVMELNDKFALLMRTKVDARTLILRAKEIFPDETLFERYEDELATLFNKHGLGGSSEKRANTMPIREEYGGNTNPPKYGAQTPSIQVGGPLCTPTKLNFDNTESLDTLSPLSPYLYSQTTYDLIDAQIIEQSGGAHAKEGQPSDNVKECELPIVPYIEDATQPRTTIPETTNIPMSSYNLGISQPLEVPKAPVKHTTPFIATEEERNTVRRELKIGEQMKSPYVKRQVVIGKNITAKERKVHE
ncbi:hypothetical protein L6452_26978 [Arctium lappa]|uniref:Uncharacterized protein n=1 Tax=Arctium lappa TaxID=4217 RepID=A0ACB8ZUM3_ARCLA|nr:hypothetical protein L6452_26978 [Arctium lappa]